MPSEVVRGDSPSQTALSESNLNEKGLCDYVVNVADGCSHGCQFCYVPSMPSIWGDPGDKFADAGIDDPADEWGNYALYREDVVENTAKDCQRLLPDNWNVTERGQGVVGISFGTDCYMDKRAGELTRGVVETLVGHGRAVRILTRNPRLLASLHGDFYAELPSDQITIGCSIPAIPSRGKQQVEAIEPGAPALTHRLNGLMNLSNVPRFVSMSPTYPTMGYSDIEATLEEIKLSLSPSVVFHEPINPRSGNIEKCIEQARESGQDALARKLEAITNDADWRLYALQQLRDAQVAAKRVGQRIHLWPDKDLAKNAPTKEQREWCRAWRERPTPEGIGDGPACREPYPEVPEIAETEQGTLEGSW